MDNSILFHTNIHLHSKIDDLDVAINLISVIHFISTTILKWTNFNIFGCT